MPIDAIVGAAWGDEGKGKWTDYLAADADFVVRFQGGRNAGHTIVNEHGRFALHLLPSGVFYPDVVNILAPGVALDVQALFDELDTLTSQGVPAPILYLSDRCQLVMPYHILLDELEENRLGEARFGSTKVGIAPFYANKAMKLGIQLADLFDESRLRERIRAALVSKNVLFEQLYDRPSLCVDALADPLLALQGRLAPIKRNTTTLLHNALAKGKRVLVEGQLGALRDPDHGVFPFSTSSSPLAASAAVSAGLPVRSFERIVAVTKAYSSCVGATPFVTELHGAEAARLRELGNEYGATTGRPRRVGFFDAVAMRHGCTVQGATEVALSLLDVLGAYTEIPICTAYEIDGRRTSEFPPVADLERATGVYESMPGWNCDISGVRSYGELPGAARQYVARVEELVGTPVRWISVGPERDAVIAKPA